MSAALAGEWQLSGGGEFNPFTNGVVNAGYRTERWSFALISDTLDVRTGSELRRGRWWVAGRFETVAAGLLISPWADGAPAPERSLVAGYLGAEGGWQRYLPKGFYVGAQGFVRYYAFAPRGEQTTLPVPDARERVQAEVVVGWWTEPVQAALTAGGQFSTNLQPHIRGQLSARPKWPIAPTVSLFAGWADGQDFLTRTRLGGLNPYVIPLAGAGWAEFYVEDYATMRFGPSAQRQAVRLDLIADLVWFDDRAEAGVGLLSRVQPEEARWFAEASLGYAPWIARQPGVGRASLWLLGGLDWGR